MNLSPSPPFYQTTIKTDFVSTLTLKLLIACLSASSLQTKTNLFIIRRELRTHIEGGGGAVEAREIILNVFIEIFVWQSEKIYSSVGVTFRFHSSSSLTNVVNAIYRVAFHELELVAIHWRRRNNIQNLLFLLPTFHSFSVYLSFSLVYNGLAYTSIIKPFWLNRICFICEWECVNSNWTMSIEKKLSSDMSYTQIVPNNAN